MAFVSSETIVGTYLGICRCWLTQQIRNGVERQEPDVFVASHILLLFVFCFWKDVVLTCQECSATKKSHPGTPRKSIRMAGKHQNQTQVYRSKIHLRFWGGWVLFIKGKRWGWATSVVIRQQRVDCWVASGVVGADLSEYFCSVAICTGVMNRVFLCLQFVTEYLVCALYYW